MQAQGISQWALVLCLALPAQAWVLRLAQRRIFWDIDRVGRSRLLAYAISAPSTIAHELAHAAAALALRVPFGAGAGGRVELFRPRRHPDGSITLGQVSVAHTDALRSSLISVAPFLLVPLMMLGINWLLLGEIAPVQAVASLDETSPWRAVAWVAATLVLPLAAFPSPGDHIGAFGALALISLAGFAGFVIYDQLGVGGLVEFGALWSSILLAPASVCAVLLVVMHPRLGARLARIRGAR